MADLAPALWGIPVVASTTERDLLFPTPASGQRVQNLTTRKIERYDGASWQADFATTLIDSIYLATLYSVTCDGTTDDRAALNTLVNTTMSAGGTVLFTGVGPRVGSNLTIPANVRVEFARGSVMKVDTGVTVTIASPFDAPLEKVFNCVGTGVIAFSAGAVKEVYPEWFGALADGGTDDTTPVGKAVNSAQSAVSASTPSGGVQIGSIPAVVLTGKEYVIASALSTGAYQIFRSRTRSRLRQTTSSAVHILFGNASRVEVTGIQFIGGKHAFQYYNNNTDTSRLLVRDCSFQLTSSFAVRVGGSGSAAGAAAVNSSVGTLAADADGFTRSDGGSFITDGFVNGMIATPSGFSNNHISTVTNVTASKVTVSGARTVESSAAGRGLEGTYSLDTNSTNVLLENCEFYRCHSLVSAVCDQFTFKDCWVSVHQDTTPANTPQIVNRCFQMKLDKLFGVTPASGTPAALRWVDNYNRLYTEDCRFGGEDGGIAGVWHRGPVAASGSDAHGTVVSIKGGYATGGAANPTSGLVIFRENIPELLVIEAVRGLGTTGVIIEGPASVYAANITTSTYLAAYAATLYDRFRARVDANLMSSPSAVPAAYKQILLRRRDQILTEPLITGTRALVDNTAAALLDVTLDSGGGADDAVAINIDYSVEDSSGASHSIETGRVAFVAARNTTPTYNGAVSKIGSAQIMLGGITMTVTFTVTVASNVVTLKVTNDTSNGDGSTIVFSATVIKPQVRANTTIALASGCSWDQAGT